MVLSSKISEDSSTRTLSHVISDIKNPKTEHEHRDRSWPGSASVAEQPAEVGRVSDNQDGGGDQGGAGDDERPATAEAAGAAVTEMADQGLDKET